MPFSMQNPDRFTKNVLDTVPGVQGVYGILRVDAEGETWIYVGKGNIHDRLLNHLNGDNPRITKERPTHFVADITSGGDPSHIEKKLIREYDPIANRRIG